MKDTLANPIIQDEKKKQVLSTIAREAGFTESTLSFLSLLVDARRIDAIDEIVEAFETKYCVLTDTQARAHCNDATVHIRRAHSQAALPHASVVTLLCTLRLRCSPILQRCLSGL